MEWGGGLWDEWHPFTISSAPEQEGEGDETSGWGGGGGCGMSGIPSLSAVLQNRRVRGMKRVGGGGGGLWDEWHPFTISSAPEQECEGDETSGWGGGAVG